jgi:diadenosine tetraphosphate (Ap4A) HIT family hydrolase
MSKIQNGSSPEGQGCFLCDPPRDLIFFECADFFALAGLGPVVQGYSLVAAKAHIKSMADLPASLRRKRDTLVRQLREQLSRKYGCCLITEHGRMAACVEDGDGHDAHCFHAHFLLFPAAPDISGAARSYFSDVETFNELGPAMTHAALYDDYVVVSPTPDCYNVFSGPLNIPRQLTRFLVAHEAKTLHLANWRDYPDRQRAVAIAHDLRSLFAGKEPSNVGPSPDA